ncbi:hypothetical protein E1265_17435 [Streptomyces sp. 8K308]|uniref:hypothetical protein n=1 Tax=Streptomyces sp. 8K308 TaxID=2530388 RepID=UPI00104D4CEC|nr:hypothetical protein [Streptomyces sp. 8K308]TDC21666.1 hypothetical protein E1265_17435 [Streptomyces sp. 8K308]
MASIVALFLGLLIGGCSDVPDRSNSDSEPSDETTVKPVDDARAEARRLSSDMLDFTGIQAQVSEPGPGVSVCAEDPERERLYKIRHAWSVYGVPSADLEQGMDRLRGALLEHGWVIVEEGELNNAARTPRILFENTSLAYAVNVELVAGTEDYEPMLTVDLVSACFSTPEGESPRGEF